MVFKKIINSKILKLIISGILVYLAFRKVDITEILKGLKDIPLWFVVVNLLYSFLIFTLTSYRWSLLIFPKVGIKELINFTRSTYTGAFYSLFFPTTIAGDLLKWMPLKKNYPQLSKSELLGSAILDRFIGFSAFILFAFLSIWVGKFFNFKVPIYLYWFFSSLFLGVILFYILVFTINIEGVLNKIPLLNKLVYVVKLLKNENGGRLIKCILISLISEFIWISQVWVVSLVIGAGFSLISVFIFVPLIALILLLPISIAGFGAREQLYLFFFSQIAISDEKTLLVSTFMGITGIINSLLGGLGLIF